MSTQTVSAASNAVPPLVASAPKKVAPKTIPLRCKRKPSAKVDAALCHAVAEARRDGFGFREILELVRVRTINVELKSAKGVKTTAAKRLGISPTHLDNYLARGKGLL